MSMLLTSFEKAGAADLLSSTPHAGLDTVQYRGERPTASRCGIWGREGSSCEIYMRGRDPFKMAAAAFLGCALVLVLAGQTAQKVFTRTGESRSTLDIGVWRWHARFETPAGLQQFSGDTCDDDGWIVLAYASMPPATAAFRATSCYAAMMQKCKAAKAFTVLGSTANAVAFGLLWAPHTSFSAVVSCLAGLSVVSYAICFAMQASLYTGDRVEQTRFDRDAATCGLEWYDDDTMTIGASFVLYCVACGLCVVGMGLALLSRGDSMQIVPV